MSRATVPECLHRGRLRQFSAQYGGWVSIKLVLLSHALVVDPDADAPSAVSVTPRRRRNSLKVWMDLCLVANVASVSKVDEPRALSLPPAARRVSHGNATPGRHVFVVTTENPAQVFRFAAESDEEREEWVRCLLLARKLQAAAAEAATASLTSPQSQPDTTAAFLRFASSGSEDSDSDAEPASPRGSDAASSPQQHSIRSARPISTSPRSPIVKPKRSSPVALTILHIVATIDNDVSVSATLPLSADSLAEIPVHRIKLDALRQLRVHLRGLDDGTRQQCRKLKQTGAIQQQDLERREPDWFALLLEDQALWLQDEKRPIGFYLAGVAKKKVTLVLRPANQTPLPVPRIVISGTKNKVSDLSQRTYTVYLVDVTFNDMTWQLARRFKEFATLHEQLEIKHPGVELPRLPSKHVFTPLEGDFVERRRLHFEKFLHSLLQDPVISNDVVFLSFLGVVSTSRDPELSQSITSVLHVTSLHNSLEYGDILLFSCKFGASILQRTFTGSKYDHVGMVVPGESRNLPRILEATSDGIQVYSLKLRLMAYSREVSNAIMVRRFNVERSPAVVEELKRFVSRVDGNPYSILGILRSSGESDRSVQDLVGKDNRDGCDEAVGSAEASLDSTDAGYASSTSSSPSIEVNSPTAATAKTRRKARQEKKRKYFCSSLVASALKHLGWLETTRKSSSFWPGSFENGGEVEGLLAPGVTLGPETRIDCRIVEVGLATPDDKAQQ